MKKLELAALLYFCWLILPATLSCGADYLGEVKPLLKHKCYACHATLKQQADLRLDTAASILRGGDSGAAVVAGKADESLLIQVLTGQAGFLMPPENEGARLTDAEIDVIRQWIADGAPVPQEESPETHPASWWSYRPVEAPLLPAIADEGWCRNELDYFVAAEREKRGLPHAGEADKATWLRRVYVDLIGLPPTTEEQRRFQSDTSSTAFEAVVDDLLNRPQYGERWGRHWMDVWRYSDWYGSRGGNEIRYSQRHIWRWRDWIVTSLNDDKGYDQMIREMLAADEICGDDPSSLPATGYLGRNWYKFDRDAWLFETVERTGEALLGLTLRCCRCHDHKFDPVTQEEYYRFRAIFEPHDVRTDPLTAWANTEKDATLGQVLTDGIARVYDRELDVVTFRFERGDSRYPDQTQPLAPGVPAALGGVYYPQPIPLPPEAWYPMLRPALRSTLVEKAQAEIVKAEEDYRQKQFAARDAAELLAAAASAPPAEVTPAVLLQDDFSQPRPERWETLSGKWLHQGGRLRQQAVANFASMVSKDDIIGDFQVQLRYRPMAEGTYRSVGFSFDYRDEGNSQDVYTSTGDSRQSVQAFHRVDGKQHYPPAGIVETSLNVGAEAVLDVVIEGSTLKIDLNGERQLEYGLPVPRRDGKFALWVHQGVAEFLALRITRLQESLETLERRRQLADQGVEIARAKLRLARQELLSLEQRLAAEVEKYIHQNPAQAERLSAAALAAELEMRLQQARLHVMHAGDNPDARADAEAELALAVSAAEQQAGDYSPVGERFPTTSSGRRTALANWLTSHRNPRTARVAVNHLWGRHFGQPLVATPENFGLNGRQPTHPQLLDWLATELMVHNWRLKPLHRRLVLSASYRMSSSNLLSEPTHGGTRHGAGSDARTASERALTVDPQNEFLWRMNSRRMEAEVVRDSTLFLASQLDLRLGGPEIPESEGETIFRRSLYFRNTPNEKMLMLETFDMADPNACYRRKASIVPHQSLALMNSGLTQDAARTLAAQLWDQSDFIVAAFECVLARRPTPAEQERCRVFLREHVELLQQEAGPVFSAGGSASLAPASEATARARENLLHVLFLHNDFVTIR